MSNVDSLHEVVTLRARVAELERERDAVTACLAGREKHLGERIQTLIESGDLSARAVAFHADRAAEMERERDEARADAHEKVQVLAAVSGVLLGNDVPSTWDHYGAVADARKCAADRAAAARLREALERELPDEARPYSLESADAAHYAREVSRCARVNEQRNRILAALASAPSAEPTPREAYMRVAEAVREACADCCDHDEGSTMRLRDLDLAAVVAKVLEVGT